MSAFVVEDKTISDILTALEGLRREGYSFERELIILGFEANAEGFNKLGQAMHQLNTDAVNQRYNDTEPARIYRHAYRLPSPMQGYKSLQCWLYQCSEGDVPEQPLFKLFHDQIKMAFADTIITRLPQYEKATWG